MKKKLRLLLLLLSTLFAVIWFVFGPSLIITSGLVTQRKVLRNSQQLILYSLNPTFVMTDASRDHKSKTDLAQKEKFHGYAVIGKTKIVDPSVKAKLIASLYDGINYGGSWGIMCFNPRHGIRAVSGSQTLDLVICFECQKIDVHTNSRSGRVYTSASPQKFFDRILIGAKVPLGERVN